jgi:hypothetical protein
MFPVAAFIALQIATSRRVEEEEEPRPTPVVIPEPAGRVGRRNRAWKRGEVPVGPYGK